MKVNTYRYLHHNTEMQLSVISHASISLFYSYVFFFTILDAL